MFKNDNPLTLLNEKERLSREETLLATLLAVLINYEENIKGTLEVGKYASMAVFSKILQLYHLVKSCEQKY